MKIWKIIAGITLAVSTAVAVPIGPFATEDWVEEKLQNVEAITNGLAAKAYVDEKDEEIEARISGLATVEQVEAVSNAIPSVAGLATVEQVTAVSNLLPDVTDFATRQWVGQSITNAVDDLVVEWDSVTNKPSIVTEEVDPTVVLSNRTLFVRNESIEIPSGGVGAEQDPIFKSWADDNTNSLLKTEVDPAFTNWIATTNFIYRNSDGKWTSYGDGVEIYPTEILIYDGARSGNIETVGGTALLNPENAAVFLNADDDGYFLKNTARDITVDLHAASLLYLNEDDGTIAVENYSFSTSSNGVHTVYGNGKVSKDGQYEYVWPAKSGVIALTNDMPSTNGFIKAEVDPAFTNWLATTNVIRLDNGSYWTDGTMSIDPNKTAQITNDWIYTANPGFKGLQLGSIITYSKQGAVFTFYGDYKKETVPIVYCDNKGTAWFPGGGVGGLALGITASDIATKSWTDGHEWTWASITNKPSVLTSETDPVFCSWTNQSVLVAGAGAVAHDGNSGYSTVIGSDAETFGNATLAVGSDVVASNNFSVAVGVYATKALGSYSTAVGSYTFATGGGSVAVGTSANAGGQYSLAVGGSVTASHDYSVSIGYGTQSHGTGTFNVNPDGGAGGFYIGNDRLSDLFVATDAIAPSWQQGSYTNGDFVIYNAHLYECTNATSGAWAPANWKQTSVTEILGNLRKILDEINGEEL